MAVVQRVVVKSNRIAEINAAFPGAIALVLQKAASETLALAQGRVPVDTGYLKNSLQIFSEGALTHGVRAGAEYAIYVEFGTRHMAAQPYLIPAFEVVRDVVLRNLVGLQRALA